MNYHNAPFFEFCTSVWGFSFLENILNMHGDKACRCFKIYFFININPDFLSISPNRRLNRFVILGWKRGVLWKVVLGIGNFGYDFWGVGGDVWRWLCRHLRRKFSARCEWKFQNFLLIFFFLEQLSTPCFDPQFNFTTIFLGVPLTFVITVAIQVPNPSSFAYFSITRSLGALRGGQTWSKVFF